jgi:hypothetical protein
MQALGTNFEGIPLRPSRSSLANFAVKHFTVQTKILNRKVAKQIRQEGKERHVPQSILIKTC